MSSPILALESGLRLDATVRESGAPETTARKLRVIRQVREKQGMCR